LNNIVKTQTQLSFYITEELIVLFISTRTVWRYQRGNQKPSIWQLYSQKILIMWVPNIEQCPKVGSINFEAFIPGRW